MNQKLTTSRLKLRPLETADAPRLQTLCGNLKVARMLEIVPHPYPDGLAETWIEEQAARRLDEAAYVFAITLSEALIGVIGVERNDDSVFVLGYWLGEPWWGQGYMSEATERVIQFTVEDLKLDKLISAYFADNPASARIQNKCGFRIVRRGTLPCRSRGGKVDAVFTELRPGDGI